MQSRGVRRPSVRPSVRLSVNFAKIASSTTEMAGSPPNLHTMVPRRACIQDMLKVEVKVKGHVIRALLWYHERNVCYTVRSHVLSLHALTLWNTIILSFQYKYQAARCLWEWATPSLMVWLCSYIISVAVLLTHQSLVNSFLRKGRSLNLGFSSSESRISWHNVAEIASVTDRTPQTDRRRSREILWYNYSTALNRTLRYSS